MFSSGNAIEVASSSKPWLSFDHIRLLMLRDQYARKDISILDGLTDPNYEDVDFLLHHGERKNIFGTLVINCSVSWCYDNQFYC